MVMESYIFNERTKARIQTHANINYNIHIHMRISKHYITECATVNRHKIHGL